MDDARVDEIRQYSYVGPQKASGMIAELLDDRAALRAENERLRAALESVRTQASDALKHSPTIGRCLEALVSIEDAVYDALKVA